MARIEGKGGISGQYIDWIMHVIAHTAIVSGICIKSGGKYRCLVFTICNNEYNCIRSIFLLKFQWLVCNFVWNNNN